LNDIPQHAFALGTTDRAMTPEKANQLLHCNLAELDEELTVRVPVALVSSILRTQLAWLRSGQLCSFGGKARAFDNRAILDEIAHLENPALPTRTKPQESLKGVLDGFWHKHFFEARFWATNLRSETERNFDTLWHRDFIRARTADPALREETDLSKLAGLMAHTIGLGAVMNRAGSHAPHTKSRLTGEWIVFVRKSDRNIYLTVAVHDESNAAIAARIWQCGAEFPCVADLLKSNGVEVSLKPQITAARP
jgi:hypothetical protein